MTKIKARENGLKSFYCPGCKCEHSVRTDGSRQPNWTFNGNFDRPTFSPSVLVKTGHYVAGESGKPCWCTYEERIGGKLPEGFACKICHSFVRDGRIEFLGDCTHELAGRTVDLPDCPYATVQCHEVVD